MKLYRSIQASPLKLRSEDVESFRIFEHQFLERGNNKFVGVRAIFFYDTENWADLVGGNVALQVGGTKEKPMLFMGYHVNEKDIHDLFQASQYDSHKFQDILAQISQNPLQLRPIMEIDRVHPEINQAEFDGARAAMLNLYRQGISPKPIIPLKEALATYASECEQDLRKTYAIPAADPINIQGIEFSEGREETKITFSAPASMQPKLQEPKNNFRFFNCEPQSFKLEVKPADDKATYGPRC